MQESTTRYIAAVVVLVLGAGGLFAVKQLQPRTGDYHPDFQSIPLTVGTYSASDEAVKKWIFNFLEADEMRNLAYRSDEEDAYPVHVSVVYGKHWRSIHTPVHCYPAQGWLIVSQNSRSLQLSEPVNGAQKVEYNRLHVSKKDSEMIVWYVLAYVGGTTANWARMGLRVATGPPGGGGMVITLTSPLDKDEPDHTDRILGQFVRAIYPPLVRSWY